MNRLPLPMLTPASPVAHLRESLRELLLRQRPSIPEVRGVPVPQIIIGRKDRRRAGLVA